MSERDLPNKIGLERPRPRVRAVRSTVQAPAPEGFAPTREAQLERALARVNPPPRRRLPPRDAAATPVQLPKPDKPKSGGASAEPPEKRKGKADKAKRQPTGDYEVGNCRPPKHGQIQKGEVRNPRGRPQGARGFNTVVRLTMEEKVVLRTARGEKKMPRVQALLLKMVESGFGGNARAGIAALNMYSKATPEKPIEDASVAAVTAEGDEAIIAAFKASFTLGEAALPEDGEDIAIQEAAATSDEEGGDHE